MNDFNLNKHAMRIRPDETFRATITRPFNCLIGGCPKCNSQRYMPQARPSEESGRQKYYCFDCDIFWDEKPDGEDVEVQIYKEKL